VVAPAERRRVFSLEDWALKPLLQNQPLCWAECLQRLVYATGIAVGDYPVDHHHGQYPGKIPAIQFPKIPSFNIPMGALIPATIDGLIVCEKGISVSNIINGSTRLQPVVLLKGQAAGILASISIKEKKEVRSVPVREVQNELLNLKCYIMPYVDVKPDNPYWEAIQRVGATGILKGVGKPEGWANKTYFYPDSTITVNEFEKGIYDFNSHLPVLMQTPDSVLTIREALEIMMSEKIFHFTLSNRIPQFFDAMSWDNELHLQHFNGNRPIKRYELAVMLDYYNQKFRQYSTDIKGKIKTD
jgi:FAD dependent oxidoreductase